MIVSCSDMQYSLNNLMYQLNDLQLKTYDQHNLKVLPIIVNEMWTQHHHLQVKDFRLRLDAEHDGCEFRVVCSVTGGHAHA